VKTKIDSIYLIIALAYLTAGIALGIGMGMAENFMYAHLHAHMNLLGFVAHGFFGFSHRLWPGLRDSGLSAPQLGTFVIGTPIFLIGLPLAQYHGQPLLAIVGSFLVLASVILFLIMFVTKAQRAPKPA